MQGLHRELGPQAGLGVLRRCLGPPVGGGTHFGYPLSSAWDSAADLGEEASKFLHT